MGLPGIGVGPGSRGTKNPRSRVCGSSSMSGVVFTAPAGTPAVCSARAAPFLSRPALQPEMASSIFRRSCCRAAKSASAIESWDDGTKRPPVVVVTACDGDPFVFSAARIDAVRRHPGMPVAKPFDGVAQLMFHKPGAAKGNAGLVQRHFDEGAVSRSFPPAKRRHYRGGGVDRQRPRPSMPSTYCAARRVRSP